MPSRARNSTGSSFWATPPRSLQPLAVLPVASVLDYAGGPSTDLLVHVFTPIFRVLDLDFPQRVLGGGGNFQYDREVPDQCNIIADYAGGPIVVLMNSLSNYTPIQAILRGTDGAILWGDIEHFGPGIRIVPANKAKKEVLIPWRGAGNTQSYGTTSRLREEPATALQPH